MSLLAGTDLQTYFLQGGAALVPAGTINGQTVYAAAEPQYVRQQNYFPASQKYVQVPAMSRPTYVTTSGQLVSNGQPITLALDTNTNHHFLAGQKFANIHGTYLTGQTVQGQNVQIIPGTISFKQQPQMQTVRHIPAFIQTSQGQQLIQLQTTELSNGFGSRLMNGNITTHQPASVTNAAAAAALATTHQVAQSRATQGVNARTLLPVQGGSGYTLQQQMGRPQNIIQNIQGTLSVRPATQGTVFTAPPGTSIVRPVIRVPKLGTVSTYNPATGVRTAPVSNGPAPAVAMVNRGVQRVSLVQPGNGSSGLVTTLSGQTGQSSATATNTALVAQVLPPGTAAGQQTMPAVTTQQQQQLLSNLRARVVTPVSSMSGTVSRPVTMVINHGQGNGSQILLSSGSVGHPALDQHSFRLMDGQPGRSTVLKVPAGAAKLQPGSVSSFMLSGRDTNGGIFNNPGSKSGDSLQSFKSASFAEQQVLQAAQNAAMNLTHDQSRHISMPLVDTADNFTAGRGAGDPYRLLPVGPSQAGVASAKQGNSGLPRLNLSLSADGFLDSSNLGKRDAPLANSPTVSSASGFNLASNDGAKMPSQYHDDKVAALDTTGLGQGAKEDSKVILACIGVELAKQGISVQSAVKAGWLGVPTAADIAVLTEAYAEQEKRMLGSHDVNGPAVEAVANQQTEGSAAVNQSGEEPAPEQFLHLQDGSPSETSAFCHGFFGDFTDNGDLLEPLEPVAANPCGTEVTSWGSTDDDSTPAATAVVEVEEEVQIEQNEVNQVNINKKSEVHLLVDNKAGGNGELAARFANLDLGCGFF